PRAGAPRGCGRSATGTSRLPPCTVERSLSLGMSRPSRAVSTCRWMTRSSGLRRKERPMIAVMPPDIDRPTPAQDRGYWFALLDDWGAPGRSYREIADWLTAEQGVSAWWAQKVIVEYE